MGSGGLAYSATLAKNHQLLCLITSVARGLHMHAGFDAIDADMILLPNGTAALFFKDERGNCCHRDPLCPPTNGSCPRRFDKTIRRASSVDGIAHIHDGAGAGGFGNSRCENVFVGATLYLKPNICQDRLGTGKVEKQDCLCSVTGGVTPQLTEGPEIVEFPFNPTGHKYLLYEPLPSSQPARSRAEICLVAR